MTEKRIIHLATGKVMPRFYINPREYVKKLEDVREKWKSRQKQHQSLTKKVEINREIKQIKAHTTEIENNIKSSLVLLEQSDTNKEFKIREYEIRELIRFLFSKNKKYLNSDVYDHQISMMLYKIKEVREQIPDIVLKKIIQEERAKILRENEMKDDGR